MPYDDSRLPRPAAATATLRPDAAARHASPADPAPPADPDGRVLGWARDLVTPALRAAVDRLPPPERRLVGYHRGWWGDDGGPLPGQAAGEGGGKAVRPALVLLGALAVGGSAADAVPAAVAVELVHDFSLLHDDVMDADTLRRHRPAAWTVFGTGAAVLAGDSLLVSAVDVLLSPATGRITGGAAAVAELSRGLWALMRGQSEDIGFVSRPVVSVPEYLAMAEGKTGSLMACACALGAVLAGAPEQRVERLRNFGRHLGTAFQCVDDLVGIWGSSGHTGKPVGADVAARKKSLPVVATLAGPGPEGRKLAELYRRREPLTPEEVATAAELIAGAGGRARAQEEAARQLSLALRELSAAEPAPEAGRHLREIAERMTRSPVFPGFPGVPA